MSGFHFHHGHDGHEHHISPKNQRLMRLATYCSVGMASVLLIAKTSAWWETESLAMLSSLTDSLFDLVSSIVNLIAVRYALKPADEEHRFGHTSIEDIAGLGQFAFISASMLIIILQSTERLFNPHVLGREMIGIWVSFAAILVTAGLVAFQTLVTRRTGSLVIASDRLHYAGDLAFNLGVIFALFLSMRFGLVWADPVIAIVIAAAVLWSNRVIGMRAFDNLMDREMPDAEKRRIEEIIQSIPEIRGVHKLKTRNSGAKAFMQMHIELDPALNFPTAHDITDRLEKALLKDFPGAEIIVHPDLHKPSTKN